MEFKKILAISGIVLSLIILVLPVSQGLSIEGKNAFAVFVLCLTLWVTNIIPMAITSLLGIALIPLLGVLDVEKSFSLFGNKALFFILGSLILAAGIHKTGLGIRITYIILSHFNGYPRRLIIGVLITAGILSCIMPEHAVAALLFPIVLQIAESLELKPLESNLGKALFLSLAWGSVIGGITTYLGGARNILAVDILGKNYGINITFFEWIKLSLPISVSIMFIAYFLIMYNFKPEIENTTGARKRLKEMMYKNGGLSWNEKKLIIILILVISLWLFFSYIINIAITAILGGVSIIILKIVNWSDIEDYLNWGIILMYGGAIVVASSLNLTGAAEWLSGCIFSNILLSPFEFTVLITMLTIILTEGISNVAAVAIILPLAFSWGDLININPVAITLLIALSGGLAFCLPMGTPPNAIAFSAAYYRISDVARVGIILNILSWVILLFISKFYWPIYGISF
jgi:solute carrier family 13 (sodium-dependent dicarboxylate transporter), member 2/3/5